MTHEYLPTSAQKKPYEVFGLTEEEHLNWRVSKERFQEIIENKQTIVHNIRDTSNSFGEFLFVTTSRPGNQKRVAMTFYGLGYHEQRERWITNEWFWYKSELYPDLLEQKIPKKEVQEMLRQRWEQIAPEIGSTTQTKRGRLFEILADLTDEDGALAEMEDLESLDNWLAELDRQRTPEEPPPTGEYLLDPESRAKLPKLYENEELGLEAKAQVKFFTPDSNWTWYTSEFDGEDIFFGLVSGFVVELGYFSLKELQEARGPLHLPIERDLHFEPKTLRELMKLHQQQHNQQ